MADKNEIGYQSGQKEVLPHYILKQQRLLLNMTQQQVADAAGISVQQYQKFESGVRNIKTASFQVACSVIEALNMDVRDFFHSQYNTGSIESIGGNIEKKQEEEKDCTDKKQKINSGENAEPAFFKPMPIQLYCELLFFIPDGKVTTEDDIFDFVKNISGIVYSGVSLNSKPYMLRNLCVDYGIIKPDIENFTDLLAKPLTDKNAGTEEIPFWKVVTTRGHLTGIPGRYGADEQERRLNACGIETEACMVGTSTGIRVKNLDEYRYDWKNVSFNTDNLDDRRGLTYSWYNFSLDDLKELLDNFFESKM